MTERPTFALLFHSERGGAEKGREKYLLSVHIQVFSFLHLWFTYVAFFLPRGGKKN